jgi:hypothetical protein
MDALPFGVVWVATKSLKGEIMATKTSKKKVGSVEYHEAGH